MKKAYNLSDLTFLHRSVSGSKQNFYSEATQAAGLFAITPSMVEDFGVPAGATYYPNLQEASSPYRDFRYRKEQALSFVLAASADIEQSIDARLNLFMAATTPYVGKIATINALASMAVKTDEPIALLLVRFCAALQVQPQVRSQPYLILLTNLLRSQYARGLV